MIYDKTIKVGDLITAYHKGIHRVTRIEHQGRENRHPLFYYDTLFDGNFKRCNRKNNCDAAWCGKITLDQLEKMKDDYTTKIDAVIIELCR